MTETWISKVYNDAMLGLSGFTVFHRDRNRGNVPHGGLLIAVRSILKATVHATNFDSYFDWQQIWEQQACSVHYSLGEDRETMPLQSWDEGKWPGNLCIQM